MDAKEAGERAARTEGAHVLRNIRLCKELEDSVLTRVLNKLNEAISEPACETKREKPWSRHITLADLWNSNYSMASEIVYGNSETIKNKCKKRIQEGLQELRYRVTFLHIRRSNTRNLDLRIEFKNRLLKFKGVVAFIMFCVRHHRWYFGPGGPVFMEAKESFEKHLQEMQQT